MARVIAMPRLGLKMTEGTVIEWRVAPGDLVLAGQIVLVIESDKAEVEVEAPAPGVVRHIYVNPEVTVACGTTLAVLTETADEAFDPEPYRTPTSSVGPTDASAAGISRRFDRPRERRQGPSPVAPAARKRARELQINVSEVRGSGPGGRITREDVDTFAAARQRRVEVADGVALEVDAQGEGPPVLLLPGFGTDCAVFGPQIAPLAEHCRVLAVNPRGVGFSDAPESERYDVETAAADAAAVVGASAHIVGASLGAAAALELALGRPELVRSLTLVTPFVRANGRLLAVLDAWCRSARELEADTLARTLVPWLFSPEFLADQARLRRVVNALARILPRVPAATLERTAAGLRFWSHTRSDALAKVAAPTLVIAGERDLLTPDAADVARAIPNARLAVVSGAGHAVTLEDPERVNSVLLAHIGAG